MRFTVAGVLAFTAAVASAARAEPSSKATARAMAIEGIDAIEAGDCTTGMPLVQKAEALFHAVVHLQYLARCHRESGRLVAASELLRRIVAEGAPEGATPAVHAALSEAERELPVLLPRLARTTLATRFSYPNLDAVLDGAPLGTEVLNAPLVLDPGEHTLSISASGYRPWLRRWTLVEGESTTLTIELVPAPPSEGLAPSHRRASTSGHAGAPGAGSPPARGRSDLATAGWITGGAGAAVLVAATATLLARNNRRGNLLERCPNGLCPPGTESEIETVERLTIASNVLFATGAAALGTGIVLVVVGRATERHGHAARLPSGAELLWTGDF